MLACRVIALIHTTVFDVLCLKCHSNYHQCGRTSFDLKTPASVRFSRVRILNVSIIFVSDEMRQ
nr:hypothetical protein [Tanacetum cinerariifolium]